MSDPSHELLLPFGATSYESPSRTCKRCGKRKPLDEFPYQKRDGRRNYRSICKDCRNALRRTKWDELTPEEKRAIGHKVHGRPLSPAEFAAKTEAQGGACAICGDTPKPRTSGRPRKDGTKPEPRAALHYDHDHATGAGRDLLCHECNVMIGYAGDDPTRLEAGAAYVRRWAALNAV